METTQTTKGAIVVIQDYRTYKVLGVKTVTPNELSKIKLNSYISLNASSTNKDQYIVKEILKDELLPSYLVKVKVNKESKSFTETTQFKELNQNPYAYLRKLEQQIQEIIKEDKRNTQINTIIKKGPPKIAKKFGEEAVELVIEAGKDSDELFIDEAADVFYYYIILLHERGFTLGVILQKLRKQKRKN